MQLTLMIILWLENGKTMTQAIPNSREGLTEAEVRKAMFDILKRKVLLSEGGARASSYKRPTCASWMSRLCHKAAGKWNRPYLPPFSPWAFPLW